MSIIFAKVEPTADITKDPQNTRAYRVYESIRQTDVPVSADTLIEELEAACGRVLHFQEGGPEPQGYLATGMMAGTGWAIVSVRLHPGTPPLTAAEEAAMKASVEGHEPKRYVTDAEYQVEFSDAATTDERRQVLRDIVAGLIPREKMPLA